MNSRKAESIESSWDLFGDDSSDDINMDNDDRNDNMVGRASSALNLALDQSRLTTSTTSSSSSGEGGVTMPEWPVSTMAHTYPVMSRHVIPTTEPSTSTRIEKTEKTAKTHGRRVQFAAVNTLTQPPLPSSPSTHDKSTHISEAVVDKVLRCVNGIGYDMKHWKYIDIASPSVKLKYILTRDDRSPVSFVLLMVLLILLLSSLSLFITPSSCASSSSSSEYDQYYLLSRLLTQQNAQKQPRTDVDLRTKLLEILETY